jgi:hypothetical protein
MDNNLRIILAFILVMLGGLYLHSNSREQHYEQQGPAAVEYILGQISDWQEHSLQQQLSAEARDTISPQQLQALLLQYRPLGRFTRIGQLKFSKLMSAMSILGDNRISYQGVVYFDVGPASITITLSEENGTFSIYNLNIKQIGA